MGNIMLQEVVQVVTTMTRLCCLQDALPVCSAAVQCLFIIAVVYERSVAQSELQTWQEAQHLWQPIPDDSGMPDFPWWQPI